MENYRLRVFRAVGAELNFRKASEALHLSQPAVSQHVQALEEELGLRLFDRSGQRIALTPAGKTLLRYATRSAHILDQARSALAALEGEAGGELKLAASTTVAQYILPRLLGPFLKENPKVTLSVVSGNTEKVVALVSEGTAQIGLIEGPPRSKQVHAEKFLSDRLVLIAPRSHEWSGVASIPLDALARAPLLLREQGSGSRRVIEQTLGNHGLTPNKLNVHMELDSTEAIVSGVEAGLGCGFVSEWAIGKELRLGTLALVPVDGLEIVRDFSLVRRIGPEPGGAAAAFARFAKAQQRS